MSSSKSRLLLEQQINACVANVLRARDGLRQTGADAHCAKDALQRLAAQLVRCFQKLGQGGVAAHPSEFKHAVRLSCSVIALICSMAPLSIPDAQPRPKDLHLAAALLSAQVLVEWGRALLRLAPKHDEAQDRSSCSCCISTAAAWAMHVEVGRLHGSAGSQHFSVCVVLTRQLQQLFCAIKDLYTWSEAADARAAASVQAHSTQAQGAPASGTGSTSSSSAGPSSSTGSTSSSMMSSTGVTGSSRQAAATGRSAATQLSHQLAMQCLTVVTGQGRYRATSLLDLMIDFTCVSLQLLYTSDGAGHERVQRFMRGSTLCITQQGVPLPALFSAVLSLIHTVHTLTLRGAPHYPHGVARELGARMGSGFTLLLDLTVSWFIEGLQRPGGHWHAPVVDTWRLAHHVLTALQWWRRVEAPSSWTPVEDTGNSIAEGVADVARLTVDYVMGLASGQTPGASPAIQAHARRICCRMQLLCQDLVMTPDGSAATKLNKVLCQHPHCTERFGSLLHHLAAAEEATAEPEGSPATASASFGFTMAALLLRLHLTQHMAQDQSQGLPPMPAGATRPVLALVLTELRALTATCGPPQQQRCTGTGSSSGVCGEGGSSSSSGASATGQAGSDSRPGPHGCVWLQQPGRCALAALVGSEVLQVLRQPGGHEGTTEQQRGEVLERLTMLMHALCDCFGGFGDGGVGVRQGGGSAVQRDLLRSELTRHRVFSFVPKELAFTSCGKGGFSPAQVSGSYQLCMRLPALAAATVQGLVCQLGPGPQQTAACMQDPLAARHLMSVLFTACCDHLMCMVAARGPLRLGSTHTAVGSDESLVPVAVLALQAMQQPLPYLADNIVFCSLARLRWGREIIAGFQDTMRAAAAWLPCASLDGLQVHESVLRNIFLDPIQLFCTMCSVVGCAHGASKAERDMQLKHSFASLGAPLAQVADPAAALRVLEWARDTSLPAIKPFIQLVIQQLPLSAASSTPAAPMPSSFTERMAVVASSGVVQVLRDWSGRETRRLVHEFAAVKVLPAPDWLGA